eukprot:s2139_g13.t1
MLKRADPTLPLPETEFPTCEVDGFHLPRSPLPMSDLVAAGNAKCKMLLVDASFGVEIPGTIRSMDDFYLRDAEGAHPEDRYGIGNAVNLHWQRCQT